MGDIIPQVSGTPVVGDDEENGVIFLELWEVTCSVDWPSQLSSCPSSPLEYKPSWVAGGRPTLSPRLCLTSSLTWDLAVHFSALGEKVSGDPARP